MQQHKSVPVVYRWALIIRMIQINSIITGLFSPNSSKQKPIARPCKGSLIYISDCSSVSIIIIIPLLVNALRPGHIERYVYARKHRHFPQNSIGSCLLFFQTELVIIGPMNLFVIFSCHTFDSCDDHQYPWRHVTVLRHNKLHILTSVTCGDILFQHSVFIRSE